MGGVQIQEYRKLEYGMVRNMSTGIQEGRYTGVLVKGRVEIQEYTNKGG